MFAVIKIGGHQYLVREGEKLKVDKLPKNEGETFELGEVLLVADKEHVKVGTPFVPGAKVKAKVVNHGRGKKVIVFKYKSKTRYRVKRGFRPEYTTLEIEKIMA